MPQGHAHVALRGGVGEVALEAGGDERGGQRVQQRAGDLQVGLAVLEADRVDLVRHGRRAGGALRAQALVEVAQRDVGPHVRGQVVGDPVEAGDVGVELGLPVVGLDLRGQRVPGQAQVLDEAAPHGLPVGAGHGDDVRAEGAGGAVDLAQVLGGLDAAHLAAQPVGQDRHLLAERRGGGRLAVRARQHGGVGVLVGHGGQVLDQPAGGRQPHLLDGAPDRQGVGEVVDVLAGAEDVDDLADRGQHGGAAVGADDAGCVGGRGQAPLEEVLDGLDVVAGLGLDGAELGDLLGPEVLDDAAQVGLLRLAQAGGAGQDAAVGEVDEPLDLDLQAGPVERGLGEVVDQRGGDGAVAAVQGAQGDGGGDCGEIDHAAHCGRLAPISASGASWVEMRTGWASGRRRR